ncbi:hypothetical protein ACFOEE_01390 [Pseudoalteromonas fenneropenaei]|uniref:Uncharacterized protein n=1 Tax=Pseudoalteromonas fenneropenaei TaxID=1737459 RepID=A0ABV7CF04_9GAMM
MAAPLMLNEMDESKVSTSSEHNDSIGPIFEELDIVQQVFLPLGTVAQLLELLQKHAGVYLQISGLSGGVEGITLEISICTPQTSIQVVTEGLYGLKNASKLSAGLTIIADLSPALIALSTNQANLASLCKLVLKPRLNKQHHIPLHIKHLTLTSQG